MSSSARLGRLLTRLLFCVAMVVCVMGLAEASAAASTRAASDPTVAAAHQAPAHAHAHAHAATASPQSAPSEGHGGHGGHDQGSGGHDQGSGGHDHGSGGHLVSCMAASGVTGFAVVLADLAGDGLVLAAPPVRRPAAAFPEALLPRPPDLRALCVQRV